MKVVLSRKGMDSEYGGIPSPIIKDSEEKWQFYSFPIPSDIKSEENVKYKDVILYENLTIADFLKNNRLKSKESDYCHLDPDIRKQYLKSRTKDWKPNFGQVKIAQSHLKNKQISKEDIFLFFGWFQFAEYKNNQFKYIKNKDYPNGFHAIYGYLQINEMYYPNINMEEIPEWLKYHPHVKFKDENEFNNSNNTIYTATDILKHKSNINLPGSEYFSFSEELILTKKNQNYRTIWELPLDFHPENKIQLSYNTNLHRWNKEKNKAILNSTYRGQEFIFKDENEIVEEWCLNLIEKYSKKNLKK
jgi:hypothetical protein